MALLQLVEAARSSGLLSDVVAWFPFLTRDGYQGMDSGCIALINAPGKHILANKNWPNAMTIPYLTRRKKTAAWRSLTTKDAAS